MTDLVPGQKLFYVPNRLNRTQPTEVEVERIGRKWVHLKNRGRIDRLTLVADGGDYSSPGKCYLSREEYEAELADDQAWRTFKTMLSARGRGSISAKTIAEAAALLFPKDESDD